MEATVEWMDQMEGRWRNGGVTRGRRREEIEEGRKDSKKKITRGESEMAEMERKRKTTGWEAGWSKQQSNRSNWWPLHSSLGPCDGWKARERSKRGWDVLSLFEFDDNTFRDKNDALTMHQSTVLWFKSLLAFMVYGVTIFWCKRNANRNLRRNSAVILP